MGTRRAKTVHFRARFSAVFHLLRTRTWYRIIDPIPTKKLEIGSPSVILTKRKGMKLFPDDGYYMEGDRT
jgi:hypothetical protein